jgi:putative inorganic carbon (hco3(-)) transporter
MNNIFIVVTILLPIMYLLAVGLFSVEFLAVILIYSIMLLIYGEKAAIIMALAMIISITGSFGESIRIVVIVYFLLTLIVLFTFKYYYKPLSFSDYPIKLSPVIALLYFSMILSSILSLNPLAGYNMIIRTSLFFIFVLLLYLNIRTYKTIHYYLYGLLAGGIIMSIGSLYEVIQNGFVITNIINIAMFRTGGFIENVNAAGGIYAILIPLSYTLYLSEKQKNKALLFLAILIVLSIGLIISNSRAAFLSLFISFFIFFSVYNRKVLLGLALVVMLTMFLILITPLYESISLLLRIEDGLSYREPLWEMSISVIRDNYLLGTGPGAFGSHIFSNFPVLLDSWEGLNIINLNEVTSGANPSHNFFMLFLSDMGILGLITSIFIFYLFIKISLENLTFFKSKKDLYLFNLVNISIAGGLFVRAFFDSVNILTYGYLSNDLPFWILFLIAIYQNTNKVQLLNEKY